MELGAWIEAYGRAWEAGDEDLMVSLFTEDANYRSTQEHRLCQTVEVHPRNLLRPGRSRRCRVGGSIETRDSEPLR
jgi:hypothetical protein